MTRDDELSIALQPIGRIRTPFGDKASAPRQPPASNDARGTVELFPGRGFEDALDGLEGFDTIWLLFHFHGNEGHWKPKVTPPRSAVKRGLFATRSPHRPNAIGMSAVRLERIEGLCLFVVGVDMVDGTPLLDIKPYVSYCDAVPDASRGWLGAPGDPGPRYEVAWSSLAQRQTAWLKESHAVDVTGAVETLLSTGPEPHAYRRIKKIDGPNMQLAHKSWRFRFVVDGSRIVVTQVRSGYRPAELAAEGAPGELAIHRAFVEEFGA